MYIPFKSLRIAFHLSNSTSTQIIMTGKSSTSQVFTFIGPILIFIRTLAFGSRS